MHIPYAMSVVFVRSILPLLPAPLLLPILLLGLVSPACALPNAILGGLVQNESPLDGEDLTEILLASGIWDGSETLPGQWVAEAGVAQTQGGYLRARPKVFGLDALLIRSAHREENLEELHITFVDAGSYFGYLDQRLPAGMSREQGTQEIQKRIAQKNADFSKLYQDASETLLRKLREIDEHPKEAKRGRTRDLRASFRDYFHQKSGLTVRLLQAPGRLIRVSLLKGEQRAKTWLDQSQESLSQRERLKRLEENVTKNERGDLFLKGVSVVPQGFRPYCGLNTLVMVARYMGLHLDEDWLAVAGKFQNTGSSAGSDMLGLYSSVAKEARFKLDRSSRYDHETVRRSLRAGMPVIVWRRWDQARDRLHSQITRDVLRGNDRQFDRPDEAALPSKKKRSPLHASVIIGYNDERKEVIFLESWEGDATPRRMPVNEISYTADLTFAFRP